MSEASKKTLGYQGGVMTMEEAEAFEKEPIFDESIRMRKWDEMAKVPKIPVDNLPFLKTVVLQVLLRQG